LILILYGLYCIWVTTPTLATIVVHIVLMAILVVFLANSHMLNWMVAKVGTFLNWSICKLWDSGFVLINGNVNGM
jgi:hypothetical protein